MNENNGSLLIANGNLLIQGMFVGSDLLVEGGIIREIGSGLQAEGRIDASGAYVLPGLIDIHTHGIGFESFHAETLHEYARLEASHGATTFYPSLFSPPAAAISHMERHRRNTNELRDLPQVGGFRLESPYLAHTGAGVAADLAPITPETTRGLLEAGGGYIKIWDVSPELPGAFELIRQLTSMGIICSIAHTQATIEQARAAVDAGASLVTHLFDTFVSSEESDPGVFPLSLIDYLLVEDRLVCEIIADGTHVLPLQVEVALRCKTPQRLAFVTDSNLGSGLPPGEYLLPGGWGKVVIEGSNDGLRLVDRGMELAGSALTPIDAFRNVVRLFHRDIPTAADLCAATPARLLGLNKGEIAVGKDADLILLTPDLNLLYTISGGKTIYQG